MANKISLSMLKGKPASSHAPQMVFRFNTADEDIEELQCDAKEMVPKEKLPPVLPLIEDKTSSISAYLGDISERTDKTEANIATQDDTHKINSNHRGESQDSFDKNENDNYSNANLFPKKASPDGKETRDPSPMKESVKCYIAKLGKRSISSDSGSNVENEGRSLLSGLKGRFTKTFEERLNRESSTGGLTGITGEKNRKGSEATTPEEYHIYSQETNSNECLVDTQSVLDNEEILSTVDDDSSTPVTEVKSEHNGVQSESSKSFYDFEDYETSKCSITRSASLNQRPFPSSNVANFEDTPLPKCMTLSSLMASKSLEPDFEEEEQQQTLTSTISAEVKEKDTGAVDIKEPDNEPVIDEQDVPPSPKAGFDFQTMMKSFWQKVSETTWKNYILSITVAFIACSIAPFPSYFSGFLMGILISFVAGSLLWWIFRPPKIHKPPILPDFSKLPPLVIKTVKEPVIYSGWMNELSTEYNPENYHISNTHSVYVRLDGTSLRLSYPKTNVPKRAMWNEPRHESVFVHQRIIDISGATVSLLPNGLPRKRLWSKKYPLCLVIPNRKISGGLSFESKLMKESPQEESVTPSTSGAARTPGSKDSSPIKKTFPKNYDSNGDETLCLFSRTDREKDEWFRRFQVACKLKCLITASSLSTFTKDNSSVEHRKAGSVDLGVIKKSSSFGEILEDETKKESNKSDKKELDFKSYMENLLKKDKSSLHLSPSGTVVLSKDKKSELGESKSANSNSNLPIENLLWLNALIGRCFYDFLTVEFWSKAVANRIQGKLSKIRLPYFMEELSLADINLGTSLPLIHRASDPIMDERGLWVDMDISYSGSFLMTLETKLNLLRLKKPPGVEMDTISHSNRETNNVPPRSHLYNSDEEDSAESSTDDDVSLPEIHDHSGEEEPASPSSGGSKSRRLLRIVDKIAQSRYFQQATEYKYVQKVMKEVSNTPLLLTVEVHWLSGTLSLNIPPLPTDRLWYGFRTNPQLSIVARPKLGGHVVTITHVTEWIEKKLVLEFQKLLVMPNMDDVIIPIMDPGSSSQRS